MSEENTMDAAKSDPPPSSVPPWAFASPSPSNRIHKRKISSPLEGIPAQHRPFMSSPTLKGYTSPTTNGEEFGSSMVFSFSSALPPISPSTRTIAVARRPSSPINHRILRSTARKQLHGEKDDALVPATTEQPQDQATYTAGSEQTPPTSFTLSKTFSLEFKPTMSPSTSTTIGITSDQFTSTSSTPTTSRVPSPFRGASPFRAMQDDSNMSDSSSSGSDTPPIISFRRHRRSISNPIPSASKRKEMLVGSGGLGGGVVYKNSGRRNSLRPKAKSLARILSQLESESHPLESEIHHEHEITSHLKLSGVEQKDGDVDMSMTSSASVGVSGNFSASGSSDEASSTSPSVAMSLGIFRENSFSSSAPSAPSTPAATSVSSTPFFQENTYQYTRMNPEMEINMLQSDIVPSPTNQIVSSWTGRLKRKASEDRFEPYLNSNLKRRAVSPSVNPNSATNSPTLSAIPASPSLPPVFSTSLHGSSPTSTSRNKIGSLFNIQDASGGFSKMSLK